MTLRHLRKLSARRRAGFNQFTYGPLRQGFPDDCDLAKLARVLADNPLIEMSRPFTILLIDDDRSVRTTIAVILSQGGFQLLEAATAEEARCFWTERNGAIDLLIVDIMLSGISGPDLVRGFFTDSKNPPVIFVTGVSFVQAVELTKSIDRSIVLPKPFRPRDLIETINRFRSPSA